MTWVTKKLTHNSSLDLMLHWIYCNIYIVRYVTVKNKLDERLVEYRAPRKYDHKKRGDKYWERVETFNRTCKSIIDIRADHIRTKWQEKVWGDKMTIMDQRCLDGQPGYGGTFADKKGNDEKKAC